MFDPEGKVYNYKCLLYNRNGVSFLSNLRKHKGFNKRRKSTLSITQVFVRFKSNSNKRRIEIYISKKKLKIIFILYSIY